MKKSLRNIFAVFCAVCLVFTLAGCKKKKENDTPPPPDPIAPTVNAYVVEREFYVGESLSGIDIFTTEGDTAGAIFWVNENYTLVEGDNECSWKFIPTNTAEFTEKTGSLTISAVVPIVKPTVNPVIKTAIVYAENKLSSVEIQLSQNDTAGTLTWANPNMVLQVGVNQCAWKFVPTNPEAFEQLTGTVSVTAIAQVVSKIEVITNPTKTSYRAFETFDSSGLTIKATYDGGKVETISSGWQVVYQQGENFVFGNNKATISYGGKTCDVAVTVSKVEVIKPQLTNASIYIYDGTNKTATLNNNSNLYTISNNVHKNAGTYNVKVTLNDFANYKWAEEETKDIILPFTISKAQHQVQISEYVGTYDGNPHTSSVTNTIETKLYYALQELNDQNYQTAGSEEKINQTNAGVYTIYYYSCGNDNYLSKAGSFTSTINKAQARVALGVDHIYSFAGENPSKACASDVTIYGINDVLLEGDNIFEFIYYTSFTSLQENQKTTAENGATIDGGAPNKAGSYIVHATYLESENYLTSWGTLELIVYPEDLGLFAVGDEAPHAWIEETFNSQQQVRQDYVTGYFEVKKLYNGYIYELNASMKVVEYNELDGSPINETTYDGKVVYVGTDVKFVTETEQFDLLVADDGTSETLTISQGVTEIKTLTKWELPTFLGRFERDTAADGETENSYIEIYVNYGTLKFEFDVKYYQSSSLIENKYTGVIKDAIGKINFYLDTNLTNAYLRQIVYTDTTLTLNSSCVIVQLQGEYTKV